MKTYLHNLLITIVLTATSCVCNNVQLQCPDRIVTYPKNSKCANKEAKVAVRDFKGSLSATVNVLKKVSVGIDSAAIESKVKILRAQLDNQSIRMEQALNASFRALPSDPCNNSARHYKLVESITAQNNELDKLAANLSLELAKVQNASTNSTAKVQVDETLNDYLYQRGRNEGMAMGKINSAIRAYYQQNNAYPASLSDLQLATDVALLGESRLEYKVYPTNSFTLRFAGQDYILGSQDDKIYGGSGGTVGPTSQGSTN